VPVGESAVLVTESAVLVVKSGRPVAALTAFRAVSDVLAATSRAPGAASAPIGDISGPPVAVWRYFVARLACFGAVMSRLGAI